MSDNSTHLINEFKIAAKSLLKARNNTLSSYKHLMSFQPFVETPLLREDLEEFCEHLVDYSGKIHFSFLSNIEQISSDEITLLADEVTQVLVDNTQGLLDFQDSYNTDVQKTDIAHLTDKLSQVGELIANRISLEDQLINTILK
jgi:regulator of sigma D